MQIAEFKRANLVTVIKSLKLGLVAFSFYGFFSGLIVPRAVFFPAAFLNYETFFKITGIPIQVFRAICAVIMTYAIVRILSLFEWETNNKISNLLEETRDSYRKLGQLEKIKDSLTHMIVHDLNNPLTGISGELQLLKMEEREFNAEQKEGLNSALTATQDLKRMISNLLDINKMEENKLKLNYEKFKLEDLAQEVANQMSVIAQIENKTVSLEAARNMLEMSADKELIRRTIANLVNNAVKYSPSGGNVLIKTFFKEEDNNFQIKVKNSGEGIPEEYLNKIFDKFIQVENEKAKIGHGLGLTFCKMAVEAHGGKIWAESELDKGSTFYFTVPANK
ncbi:MAG: ATP-binding protein [Candidatus Omnitrophota bacterium]